MAEVSDALISAIVKTIAEEVRPRQIYVFGSCAKGTNSACSDLDLLIVKDQDFDSGQTRWNELKRIRRVLRPFRVPKDILLYSQGELEKWRCSLNHIVAHAMREGRLVYDRS